jgi:hypothetical protein
LAATTGAAVRAQRRVTPARLGEHDDIVVRDAVASGSPGGAAAALGGLCCCSLHARRVVPPVAVRAPPGGRRQPAQRSPAAPSPGADGRASATGQFAALVDVDNAIRSSAEELAFAEAQFGVQATRGFKAALDEARTSTAEAFSLQRELEEAQAMGQLSEHQLRDYFERIIALASSADQSLDAQEAEFSGCEICKRRSPSSWPSCRCG